jgi:class 3 adenylate cyclase
MQPPDTHYVEVDGAQVAYQVIGDGPIDLLWCYGLGIAIDLVWETPQGVDYLSALASFSRLILFDRRGIGSSGPVPADAFPTWEALTEDMAAVMAAVGSRRAALMATLETGPIAMLYAAMHPDDVLGLVLLNTTARYLVADDYPIGVSAEDVGSLVSLIDELWGTEEFALMACPSAAGDPEWTRWLARLARASATPKVAARQEGYFLRDMDVRGVLGHIQTPTLVLHSRDNAFMPQSHAQYLADNIEGARLVTMDGGDLGPPTAETVADIAEFLTGQRPAADSSRLLTTVMFSDIVGSTERAVAVGDRRWREMIDLHHRITREQLRRCRGCEVDTAGDGFVVTFDGPARAIRCAEAMSDELAAAGLNVRIGLHTGECEFQGDQIRGVAVHLAARVSAQAGLDEILVSSTVKDLVMGSGIEFEDRGAHELKGVPGSWNLYSVRRDRRARTTV